MITKKQFENFAERQGVTPDSAFLYELCKATWLAAEQTCLKSYNQVPALLGNQAKTKDVPLVIEYDESEDECEDNEDCDITFCWEEDSLNQKEIQYLTTAFRQVLQNLEKDFKWLSHQTTDRWNLCNPDDPKTLPYFESLNAIKTEKARVRAEINKLANIQRKLKRMR